MSLTRFAHDRDGNVATMFALAIIPIFGFVGAAVDYSRAAATRTSLQTALDSAALSLSKEASGLTSEQLKQKATTYVTAQFNRPEAKNLAITVSYQTTPAKLTLGGTANLDSTFMKVVGIQKMDIGSSTTVQWSNSRLRVALVLDNTGSMASAGKMTALKTATKSLLATLKKAAVNPEDVYVSIIPFSKNVNVGSSNYGASWIDWTAWNANNGSCWSWWGGGGSTQGSCSGTWTPANHNTWNGCVTDRGTSTPPGTTAGYDQKIDAPVAGTAATLFPAEQYSYCPVKMMGLSYDWSAMNTLVDQMSPDGSTSQPIGLIWGWQSLVGGGPLTAPPKDANYQYKDIIILLSDGLNTQDRWYGNGSSVSTSVDARMYNPADGSGTCKNVKAAGVTIYTVHVNTDGDPTSTLLKNCATDVTKFFILTSANQIVTTFEQIGTSLSKLYIAK